MKRARSGLTLVETMVVLLVIGVVAALAWPRQENFQPAQFALALGTLTQSAAQLARTGRTPVRVVQDGRNLRLQGAATHLNAETVRLPRGAAIARLDGHGTLIEVNARGQVVNAGGAPGAVLLGVTQGRTNTTLVVRVSGQVDTQ